MANETRLYFGSLNLASYDLVLSTIRIKESKSIKLFDIPRIDGSVAEQAKRKSLVISVEGTVIGSDYDLLRANIDTVKAALQSGLQKFTTDDDRYMMAQMQSFNYEYRTLRTFAEIRAEFLAHYPFWLSETMITDERTPTSGVGYTITNNGNAPTRVKVEFTAPVGGIVDNIQMENITRSELFKYRGTVVVGQILEVDNRVDSDDFQVLNNGVDDHKNFEGDFFTLVAGANTIKFTGQAGTIVKLSYRDAWY